MLKRKWSLILGLILAVLLPALALASEAAQLQLTSVTFLQNGQTLRPGNMAEIQIQVSGVETFYGGNAKLVLVSTINDSSPHILDLDFPAIDMTSGALTLKGSVETITRPGEYVLQEVWFSSSNGYKTFYASDFEAIGADELHLFVENPNTDYDAPVVLEAALSCGDRAVVPDERFTLQLQVQETSGVVYASASFSGSGNGHYSNIQPESYRYDANTGLLTFDFVLPRRVATGSYRLNSISLKDSLGNSDSRSLPQTLYLNVQNDLYSDYDDPVLAEITLPENGQTLQPGQTLTVNVKIDDASPMQQVTATLYLQNRGYEIELTDFTQNADGVYTQTYTIPAAINPGSYRLYSVEAVDLCGNDVSQYYYSSGFPQLSVTIQNDEPQVEPLAIQEIIVPDRGPFYTWQRIPFQVQLTDNRPISWASVRWADLSTIGSEKPSQFGFSNTDYDARTGTLLFNSTPGSLNKPGEYTIYEVSIYDAYGNSFTFDQDDLQAFDVANKSFTLLNNNTDFDPPVVLEASVSCGDEPLFPGDVFTLQVKVQEASGIRDISASFRTYGNGASGYIYPWGEDFRYDAATGLITVPFQVPDDVPTGVYSLNSFYVYDTMDNTGHADNTFDWPAVIVHNYENNDFQLPVFEKVSIEEAGQTLRPGDTFTIRTRLASASPIANVYAKVESERYATLFELNAFENMGDRWYEQTFTIPEDAYPGKYQLEQLRAEDDAGRTTSLSNNGSSFPQISFTVENDSIDITGPVLTGARIVEEGPFHPGDRFTLELTIQEQSDITSLYASLTDPVSQYQLSQTGEFTYDPATGLATLMYEVSTNTRTGDYVLSSFSAWDSEDNHASMSGSQLPGLTVPIINDVCDDFDKPELVGVSLPGGNTVRAGERFTVQMELREASQLSSAGMDFYSEEHSKWLNAESFTYDPATGLCLLTFDLPISTRPGEYNLSWLSARDIYGNYMSISEGSGLPSLTITVENDNTDFEGPALMDITMEQNGQTIAPGDTVTIRLTLSDESGTEHASVSLYNESEDCYLDSSSHSMSADGSSYTIEYTIPRNVRSGEYVLVSFNATDNIGNNSYLDQSQLPALSVFVQNPNTDFVGPVIGDVRIVENGQTFRPGDTVTVEMEVSDESGIDYVSVGLRRPGDDESLSCESQSYSEQNGVYTLKYLISVNARGGEYVLDSARAQDKLGNSSWLDDWELPQQSFFVETDNTDFEGPVMTDIRVLQNGQTLKPGDTVTVQMTVADATGVDEIYADLQSVVDGHTLNRMNQRIDPDAGVCTITIDIPNNARAGEYVLNYVWGYDWLGNSSSLHQEDLPVQSIFVENDNTDFDPPVVTDVTLVENGQTLRVGDTFTVLVTVSDESGIDYVDANLRYAPEDHTLYASEESYNPVTHVYTLQYTVPPNARNGEYELDYVHVRDVCDNYDGIHRDELDGQSIFVENDNTDFDAPAITDVQLVENGRTLKPGDTVTVRVSVTDASEIIDCSASISHAISDDNLWDDESVYDGQTYTFTYEIPWNAHHGKYMLKSVWAEDIHENSVHMDIYNQFFMVDNPLYTDYDPPVISEVQLMENGQTLRPGDTFTIRARIEDPSGIDYTNVRMEREGDELSIDLDELVYQAATGYYELTYRIPATLEPGRYFLRSVQAEDEYGNYDWYDVANQFVIIDNPDVVVDNDPPIVQEIALLKNGQAMPAGSTARNGDTITLRVTAVDEKVYVSRVWANFYDGGKKTVWSGDLTAVGGDVYETSFTVQGGVNAYPIALTMRVWDAAGNSVLLRDEATAQFTFTVEGSGVEILSQPVDLRVKVGERASFAVTADGENLKYQWQYRRSETGAWTNLSSVSSKTATVSFTAQAAQNGWQYRCYVTNGAGQELYSEIAALAVGDPITITSQPADLRTQAGKRASFAVEAEGEGLKYQWQYRRSETGAWTNLSSVSSKTATVSFTAQNAQNGWQYRCYLTDKAGNELYSAIVTLTLGDPISIISQPTNLTVQAGKKGSFSVVAEGEGLKYQWQYRRNVTGAWTNLSSVSSKTATVSFTAQNAQNGWQYRCYLTDKAGNELYSATVTLTLGAPITITSQPANLNAELGKKGSFSVVAEGEGLKYQWQYRRTADGEWKNLSSVSSKTATVSFTTQAAQNGWQYRCQITDAEGNVVYSNVATLTIGQQAIVITSQPANLAVAASKKASFSVKAEGEELAYQWMYRKTETGEWKNLTSTSSKTENVSFIASAAQNGWQYRCQITDAMGNSIYTNVVTLTVTKTAAALGTPNRTSLMLDGTALLDNGVLQGGEFRISLTETQGAAQMQMVTNDQNGLFSFAPISFTREGMRHLVVRQLNAGQGSFHLDDAEYHIEVEVWPDADGNLLIYGQPTIKRVENGVETVVTEIVFTNEIAVSGNVPMTGDDTPLALWCAAALVSLLGMLTLRARKQKRS